MLNPPGLQTKTFFSAMPPGPLSFWYQFSNIYNLRTAANYCLSLFHTPLSRSVLTSISLYTCTCVRVYKCACVHVYKCTGIHVYVCTSVNVYMCTSVHVYIYVYVYKHARLQYCWFHKRCN